jgi:hypothetical protein
MYHASLERLGESSLQERTQLRCCLELWDGKANS